MEISFKGILKYFSKKDIDEINAALDKFDPVAYEQREKELDTVLGFDRAATSYLGDNENLVGLTTWLDTRTNLHYELKTRIEIEVYGKLKFKDYWYITTINGKNFKRACKKECSLDNIENIHQLYKRLFFSRARFAFMEDRNTDLSPAFD